MNTQAALPLIASVSPWKSAADDIADALGPDWRVTWEDDAGLCGIVAEYVGRGEDGAPSRFGPAPFAYVLTGQPDMLTVIRADGRRLTPRVRHTPAAAVRLMLADVGDLPTERLRW